MSDERKPISPNTWRLIESRLIEGSLDVQDDLGRNMRVAARKVRDRAHRPLPDPFLDAYYNAPSVSGFRRGDRLQPHPFIDGLEVSQEGDVHYHGRELQPRRITFTDTGKSIDVVLIDRPPIKVQTDIEGAPISLHMKAVPVRLIVLETFDDLGDEPIHPNDRRLRAWMKVAREYQ